tara:strand:+ start:1294 stop:2433 length:1140 start_codon:yes stop_codon:yes gene_type:complete
MAISDLEVQELETAIETIFSGYRFFDFRIIPELLPSRQSDENSFEWSFNWKCRVGRDGEKTLSESDLSADQSKVIDDLSSQIGWRFIQQVKQFQPVPWEGCSFNLTSYSGHKSWKYVSCHPTHRETSFSPTISDKSHRRVVGILQVKNSDLFISTVIENTLDMLDWLVILDNNSTDNTLKIVKQLSSKNDNIITKEILTVNSGGRFLHSLCGTDTVVVKIDADEVWCPYYSKNLRNELVTQDFNQYCCLKIHDGWFHVDGIDINNEVCSGKYEDMKLYYFGNILAWCQPTERLHGIPRTLRDGVEQDSNRQLETSTPTGRPAILHFPFLCLSSNGKDDFRPGIEKNKQRYIEKNKKNLVVVGMNDFNISECLSIVLHDK